MVKVSVSLLATLVTFVAAQDDNSTCSTSLNATSQADLDGISQCSEFDADLVISGGAVLTLNGVQNITGDFTIQGDSDLTSFSAPQLTRIDGTFRLQELTILNTLNLPVLYTMGNLVLQTLPALEQLELDTGLQKVTTVTISDTGLRSLSGLNLSSEDLSSLDVNNNREIGDIEVLSTHIDTLDISYNAAAVTVNLPLLENMSNATFQAVSNISMPNLVHVSNSLGFINTTVMTIAAKNLTTVGGSLAINGNANLSNLTFPVLTTIGGAFQIANNSNLNVIAGFPKLQRVSGAVEFDGSFTQAILPSINEVDGGVTIESDQALNCSYFDQAHSDGDIHGDHYVCKGAQSSTSVALTGTATGTAKASSTGASGSGSAKASSSSSNQAVVVTAGAGLVSALLSIFVGLL